MINSERSACRERILWSDSNAFCWLKSGLYRLREGFIGKLSTGLKRVKSIDKIDITDRKLGIVTKITMLNEIISYKTDS